MLARFRLIYALLFAVGTLAVFTGGRLAFKEATSPWAVSSLYGWDSSFYYFWLRSVVLDGDIDFENEVLLCDSLPEEDRDLAINGLGRTDTGLVRNQYPVGWAVFYLPWFALGHGAALLGDALGAEVRTDGFGKVYESALLFGSGVFAAASLWFTLQLLLRFFDKEIAWASLVLVWASSFLIFYQLRQYGMAHGLAYLCVSSAFYWAFAIRDTPTLRRGWVMLGASVGLLAITRSQAVLYLIFPALVVLEVLWRRRAQGALGALCLLVVAFPVALQLFAWKKLYGTWLVYTYQGAEFNWSNPEWYRALFDANHGLFYWHPIFVIGLVGLIVFSFSTRVSWAWSWFVTIGLVYVVNASWSCWWFGYSFGSRAYEGVTLFAFLGVGALLQEGRSLTGFRFFKPCLYVALCGLSLWNIGILGAVQYPWITGISLEGAESYRDLALAIVDMWFRGASLDLGSR